MALPIWPGTVPSDPQRSTYRISEPFNQRDVTEFEAGNTRSRPRGSVIYRKIDQVIRMTQAQFAIFDVFVKDDLVQGSLRFSMPVWLGSSKATKTVRLGGQQAFSVSTKGTSILVSMTLEVEL